MPIIIPDMIDEVKPDDENDFVIRVKTITIKERCHVEVDLELKAPIEPHTVNCPHCEKQYLIHFKDLFEEVNQFVCKQCQGEFWIQRSDFETSPSSEPLLPMKTEQIIGIPQEKCPKCGHSVERLDQSCGHCGVIGSKYLALRDDSPYLKVSDSLKRLWKRVLNHFEDEPVHHEFLSQCLKENQLRYASLQYKQLKEAVGEDEIVVQMIKKIQNLSQMKLDEGPKVMVKDPINYSKFFRWEFILFFIGGLFILSGVASPAAKNLVSLGVVFLALPFLISVFLKK